MKNYFVGLDSIRAIAALSVLIAHIEVYKSHMGLATFLHGGHTYILGKKPLTVFFILSGFLITYKLLSELQCESDIDLKKFYWNRMLRILPLYYLVVALGFFVYPLFLQSVPAWDAAFFKYQIPLLIIHLLLIPNFSPLFSATPLPYVGPLWSIGVEQQFYIAWPFLMRKLKNNLALLFGLVIAVCTLIKAIVFLYGSQGLAYKLSEWLEFESFAFGALAAYFLINKKERVIEFVFQKKVQILCGVFLIWAGYNATVFWFLDKIIFGTCLTILLLNIAANPSSILKLQYRPLLSLGKISYGIYAYHTGVIILLLNFLDHSLPTKTFNLYLYAGTLGITILIAGISYRFFEFYFLRKKESPIEAPSTL